MVSVDSQTSPRQNHSEYSTDGNLFEKAFPCLYPYGMGGIEGDQPVTVDFSDTYGGASSIAIVASASTKYSLSSHLVSFKDAKCWVLHVFKCGERISRRTHISYLQ